MSRAYQIARADLDAVTEALPTHAEYAEACARFDAAYSVLSTEEQQAWDAAAWIDRATRRRRSRARRMSDGQAEHLGDVGRGYERAVSSGLTTNSRAY